MRTTRVGRDPAHHVDRIDLGRRSSATTTAVAGYDGDHHRRLDLAYGIRHRGARHATLGDLLCPRLRRAALVLLHQAADEVERHQQAEQQRVTLRGLAIAEQHRAQPGPQQPLRPRVPLGEARAGEETDRPGSAPCRRHYKRGVQTELAPVAACCRRGAGTEQGGGSAPPRRRRPALDLAEIAPPWRRTGGNTGTAPGAYLTAQLAGVGQCAAHLIRHAKGVLELHPTQQQWAEEVITVLCEAAAAVTAAQADGRDHLDPELLAQLRRRYDHAVSWGITTNRHRDWPKGNHPGYNLATRLRDKAEQVWTFTRNLAVPWTNNASEQALKGPKRHQAVSGYWHTLSTLAAYCRVRSYLVSARGHHIRAIDAIHNALTGNPWLPTPATA